MKISESWLRSKVNPALSTAQLVHQLTMAGLEVDAVTPVAGAFSGVVVARIVSASPHPDAQKLQVCQVDAGPVGQFQIVCGAANARPGILVPLATLGAQLPGGLEIKRAKLRGVESFGMLCGQTELAAGEDDSGLWELPAHLPLGQDLRQAMNLDDNQLELGLTPNRGDCLSLRGLAREVAALNGLAYSDSPIAHVAASHSQAYSVQLQAPEACPRYCSRVISGVDNTRPSPEWLTQSLNRAGIRSLDALVDITNYVLLELGQPMHAFDASRLEAPISVRWAQPEESLTLLNQQTLSLSPNTLVIADAHKACALAGIMGGAESAVSSSTHTVVLESAFFQPLALAGRARQYGLHTDASHRFERGVDPNLAQQAIERATQLILDITGGQAGPLVVAESAPHLPASKSISLNKARLGTGLGLQLDSAQVTQLLGGLGLHLLEESPSHWQFSVPSHRFDLSIEADLLEEIARLYGYDHLPSTGLALQAPLPTLSDSRLSRNQLKQHLISRDYQEVITYSFIDPKWQALFFPNTPAIALQNPISADMGTLRTSLIPSLVHTLKNNLNRQHLRVRLFETGLVFNHAPGYPQHPMLAGLIYGNRQPSHWAHSAEEVDFFDLKGDVVSLLGLGQKNVQFVPATDAPHLHPGQSAYIQYQGQTLGLLGALHPTLSKQAGFNKPVWVFELALNPLLEGQLPAFKGISRFPEVSRDIALVVDKHQAVAALENAMRAAAGSTLKEVTLFDVYTGQGIAPHQKSLAFSLIFQDTQRTLGDEDIQTALTALLTALQTGFNATLR